MNLRPHRRLRAIPALLGLGLVASSILGATQAEATQHVASTITGTAAGTSADPTVDIVLSPSGGGVVQPDSDLTVTATLTNTGQNALAGGTLLVSVDRDVIDTRAGLADWKADTSAAIDRRAIAVSVPTPELAPNDPRPISVTIPAASLDLDEWGVYGLAGSLQIGGTTVADARGSIVWNTGTAPDPASVALAMPITTQASQSGLIPAATLAAFTADGGLLTRQLDSVFDRGIAIMIDPRIIVSIRVLGSSAPNSAVAWLGRLQSATNPIYPLAYADTDLTSISQAGIPQIPAPASFDYALSESNFANQPATVGPPAGNRAAGLGSGSTSSATSTPSPAPGGGSELPSLDSLLAWDYTATNVAWPRDATVTSGDLPFFQANGMTTSILSSSNLVFPGVPVPAGIATVGTNTVLVSDAGVSAALRDASTALTDNERDRARAELASSLAVVALQDEGRNTVLLATFDRDPPAEGSAVTASIDSIGQLPWSAPASFDAYLAQTPTADATVVDAPQAAERTAQVSALINEENQLAAFSSVLDDPTKLLGESRASALALLSNSWTSNPGGWSVALQAHAQAVAKALGSVSIVDGSPITLVSDTAAMPVLVQNTLPYPVTVTLRLAPSNFRLVVEQEVTITIEASSNKQAKVPIKAGVANGDTTVRVELISPTGVLISPEPTIIPVNVSADWEIAGSWLVGSVVSALLIVAAIRLIRRHRRRERTPDAPAPGESETHD